MCLSWPILLRLLQPICLTVVKFYSYSSTIFVQINSVAFIEVIYGVQWRYLDLCVHYVETALVCVLAAFVPSLIPVTLVQAEIFFFGLETVSISLIQSFFHLPLTLLMVLSSFQCLFLTLVEVGSAVRG